MSMKSRIQEILIRAGILIVLWIVCIEIISVIYCALTGNSFDFDPVFVVVPALINTTLRMRRNTQ